MIAQYHFLQTQAESLHATVLQRRFTLTNADRTDLKTSLDAVNSRIGLVMNYLKRDVWTDAEPVFSGHLAASLARLRDSREEMTLHFENEKSLRRHLEYLSQEPDPLKFSIYVNPHKGLSLDQAQDQWQQAYTNAVRHTGFFAHELETLLGHLRDLARVYSIDY